MTEWMKLLALSKVPVSKLLECRKALKAEPVVAAKKRIVTKFMEDNGLDHMKGWQAWGLLTDGDKELEIIQAYVKIAGIEISAVD